MLNSDIQKDKSDSNPIAEGVAASAEIQTKQPAGTFKWYILNVVSGQENKIATEIRSMMTNGAFQGRIAEVLVPTKSLIKVKRGQKVQEQQKLFPSYIFISCDLSPEIRSALKSIPKAIGFLGGSNQPEAVSSEKMAGIISMISNEVSDNKVMRFEIGETLNINEGPFESFTGTVESYDSERQKVKLSVLIFGRATSVELDINQVDRPSE